MLQNRDLLRMSGMLSKPSHHSVTKYPDVSRRHSVFQVQLLFQQTVPPLQPHITRLIAVKLLTQWLSSIPVDSSTIC